MMVHHHEKGIMTSLKKSIVCLLILAMVLPLVPVTSFAIERDEDIDVSPAYRFDTVYMNEINGGTSPSSGSIDRWNGAPNGSKTAVADPTDSTRKVFSFTGKADTEAYLRKILYMGPVTTSDTIAFALDLLLPSPDESAGISNDTFRVTLFGNTVVSLTYDSTEGLYVGTFFDKDVKVAPDLWNGIYFYIIPTADADTAHVSAQLGGSLFDGNGEAIYYLQAAASLARNSSDCNFYIKGQPGCKSQMYGDHTTLKKLGEFGYATVSTDSHGDYYGNFDLEGKVSITLYHELDLSTLDLSNIRVCNSLSEELPVTSVTLSHDAKTFVFDFSGNKLPKFEDVHFCFGDTARDMAGNPMLEPTVVLKTKGDADELPPPSDVVDVPAEGFVMPDKYNTGYRCDEDLLVDFFVKYPELADSDTVIISESIARKYNYEFSHFRYISEKRIHVTATSPVYIHDFYMTGGGISNGRSGSVGQSSRLTVAWGEGERSSSDFFGGSHMTISHCYIHDVGADHIKGSSEQIIEFNYFRDGGTRSPGAHADVIQFMGSADSAGMNVKVYGNRFDIPPLLYDHVANCAFFFKPESNHAGYVNVQCVGNWLNGGGYTTYLTPACADTLCQQIYYNDNRWGYGHQFGPMKYLDSNRDWITDNSGSYNNNGYVTELQTGSVVYYSGTGDSAHRVFDAADICDTEGRVLVNFANYMTVARAYRIEVTVLDAHGSVVAEAYKDGVVRRYTPYDEYAVDSNKRDTGLLNPENGSIVYELIELPDLPCDVEDYVDITGLPADMTGCSISVKIYDTTEGNDLIRTSELADRVTDDAAPSVDTEADRYLTVKFVDNTGNLIAIKSVKKGEDAVPPVPPVKDGYYFAGWISDYTNVESNITVVGLYLSNDVTYDTPAIAPVLDPDFGSADWWGGAVATSFAGGDGSAESPYQIATPAQLAYLAQLTSAEDTATEYNAAHYVLTADLYLNDPTDYLDHWNDLLGSGDKSVSGTREDLVTKREQAHLSTPISSVGKFEGVFDGDGHTIYGFVAYFFGDHTKPVYNVGLFAKIGDATICDLNMAYASVYQVKTNSDGGAGVICGYADSESGSVIDNCHVVSSNVYSNSYGGGLVGVGSNVTVSDSTFSGNVSLLKVNCTRFGVGGISGTLKSNALIKNCTVSGVVESYRATGTTTHHLGGILGDGGYGSCIVVLANCANYADVVSHTNAGAGGIVSRAYGTTSSGKSGLYLVNCINYGDVSSATGPAGAAVAVIDVAYNGNEPRCGLHLYNFINYGAVTGASAGQVAGTFGSGSSHVLAELRNVVLWGSASAHEGGTAGVLFGTVTAGAFVQTKSSNTYYMLVADHVYYSGSDALYGTGCADLDSYLADHPEQVDVSPLTDVSLALAGLSGNAIDNEYAAKYPANWALDAGRINGASLQLGNSVAINLYARQDVLGFENWNRLIVKENGLNKNILIPLSTVVLEQNGVKGDYFHYVLDINPSQIADLFDFELNGSLLSYGVEQYAKNKYNKASNSPELNLLLEALMTYGDAARVNKELEPCSLQAVTGVAFDGSTVSTAYGQLKLLPATGADPAFISTALDLNGTISLLLRVAEGVQQVEITYYTTDASGNATPHTATVTVVNGLAVYDGVVATALNLVFTLNALDENGDSMGQMSWNVSRFISSGVAGDIFTENEKTLARALALYMQSCRAYMKQQDPDNSYTVTFKDHDGTVLKTDVVYEGGTATPPADPTRDNHTFVGWSVALDNVRSDLTAEAVYAEHSKYKVTFLSHDLSLISEVWVYEGKAATAPALPDDGSVFVAWDCDFSAISHDLTVTAICRQAGNYAVVFRDAEGSLLKVEELAPGSTATAPEAPAVDHHTHIGWSVELTNVQSDLTAVAVYEEDAKYTVTFLDHDGTVLKQQTVYSGMPARAPFGPDRENYAFIGWDSTYDSITCDTVVTAQYRLLQRRVTFAVPGVAAVPAVQIIDHGSLVSMPDAPVRPGCRFVEWRVDGVAFDPTAPVTADILITAYFEPTGEVPAPTNTTLAIDPDRLEVWTDISLRLNIMPVGLAHDFVRLCSAEFDFISTDTSILDISDDGSFVTFDKTGTVSVYAVCVKAGTYKYGGKSYTARVGDVLRHVVIDVVTPPQYYQDAQQHEDQKITLGSTSTSRIDKQDFLSYPTGGYGDANIALWYGGTEGVFTMTADDNANVMNDWQTWKQLLDLYGIPTTFITPSDATYSNEGALWKVINDSGLLVQTHGATHLNIDVKHHSTARIWHEFYYGQQQLAMATGRDCLIIGYAFGANYAPISSLFYIAGRGTVGTSNSVDKINYNQLNSFSGFPSDLAGELEKLLGASASNGWISVHYHSIGDQNTVIANYDLLAPYIESGLLWTPTFLEAAQYGQERDTATLTVLQSSGDMIRLSLSDEMNDTLYYHPLTVRVKVDATWQNARAYQDGEEIGVQIVSHGGETYLLVDAVPDRGEISVVRTELDGISQSEDRISFVPTDSSFAAQQTMTYAFAVSGEAWDRVYATQGGVEIPAFVRAEQGVKYVYVTFSVNGGAVEVVPVTDQYDGLDTYTVTLLASGKVLPEEGKTVTVSTPEELALLAEYVRAGNSLSGCTVELTCDLDMSGVKMRPIGFAFVYKKSSTATYYAPFSGIFEGNGHTITGLSVCETEGSVGLFGYLSGATVRNLRIEGSVTGAEYVGGIAGQVSASDISDCSFFGTVTATAIHQNTDTGCNVGGLVGILQDSGTVSHCEFEGSVLSFGAVNCDMNTKCIGGIVGFLVAGVVDRCTVTGNIQAQVYNPGSLGSCVGGIAGRAAGKTSGAMRISNCIASVTVSGGDMVGGIVGSMESSSSNRPIEILNCSVSGSVTGGEHVGGICGAGSGLGSNKIVNCFAAVTVNAADTAVYAGTVMGGYGGSLKINTNFYIGSLNPNMPVAVLESGSGTFDSTSVAAGAEALGSLNAAADSGGYASWQLTDGVPTPII